MEKVKRILLISTIYPLPDARNKGTKVCHFFARDWVKIGYDVRAVHIQAIYPRLLYWVAKLNARRIAAKTGAVLYTERLGRCEFYEMDGVSVMRTPVFKLIPHGRFSPRSIRSAVKAIVGFCQTDGVVPDVVVGHFSNPQLEILSRLKKEFPGIGTALVMHINADTDVLSTVYGRRLPALMKDIDAWGFRCNSGLHYFEKKIDHVDKTFTCYSGLPAHFIVEENTRDFQEPLSRFLYVGTMIERKYPEKVLEALETVYPDRDYHLTYIGEGQQIELVKRMVTERGLGACVSMPGRIPREQTVAEYDKAECMVMISRDEAYGLVYLEAMARGCITIAARNEGFDGIIVDGENGFLCEAGNAAELAQIIRRINLMSPESRRLIAENAITTARNLTDEKAARMYIENVEYLT